MEVVVTHLHHFLKMWLENPSLNCFNSLLCLLQATLDVTLEVCVGISQHLLFLVKQDELWEGWDLDHSYTFGDIYIISYQPLRFTFCIWS